jgi:hypothetical protein
MSIVKKNLLTEKYYAPYCVESKCSHGMPRTQFNGEQFECGCGWKSQFNKEFIEKYLAYRKTWKDKESI